MLLFTNKLRLKDKTLENFQVRLSLFLVYLLFERSFSAASPAGLSGHVTTVRNREVYGRKPIQYQSYFAIHSVID